MSNPLLRDILKNHDAVLVSSHGNIIYLLQKDFGFSIGERECLLLITKNSTIVITDARYSEAVSDKIRDFEVRDSGAIHFFRRNGKEILKELKIKKIGFEENNLTYEEYSLLKEISSPNPIDLRKLRLIKTESEVENIKKACGIGDKTFEYILKKIREGITEAELSDKIETFINSKGADFSFKPIVAFGKNSSIPHHLSDKTKLGKNQIVLLDYGVKVNNYCSDMTRTVFFGSASTKFKQMYQTTFDAQFKTIQFLKSSIINQESLISSEVDKIAREHIIKQGFPTIPHSLGHGIGIEVHEFPHLSPISQEKLEIGMVFSVEPGIYLPNYGGVRIEDLVYLGKNGPELISNANREIIEAYAG